MSKDPRLLRVDSTRLELRNDLGLKVSLFVNEKVSLEAAAVSELLQLLDVQKTAESFAKKMPEAFDGAPEIAQVAVTPDFHKGTGVPVGTVIKTRGYLIPQAIGNDINCGMRMQLTSLSTEKLLSKADELEQTCRHVFFEGGRNIPMTRAQREALLREGLVGLLNATSRTQMEGLWSGFHAMDVEANLDRVEHYGSLTADAIFGLDDFMGAEGVLSRDAQIGSIGGGNHFVEFQKVAKILDGSTAYAWGLKEGMVVVMIHTGSVSIGHVCGGYFRDVVRKLYPEDLKHPENGVFVLPMGGRYRQQAAQFWDALHNAANFAFANRLFLALMAQDSLARVYGETECPLLYDAPHNLVWPEEAGGTYLHRKGACPARGLESMQATPFQYSGEPVLVPGSMGSSSFILAGQGNPDALSSASHGAGRSLSRGEALKGNDGAFKTFMETFRVVTRVDLNRPDIKLRRDIVDKKLSDIKQEAPHAYKAIGPVIQTLTDAGIARPVAELWPLLTIKG